jgi:small ubiquitin-related modifier
MIGSRKVGKKLAAAHEAKLAALHGIPIANGEIPPDDHESENDDDEIQSNPYIPITISDQSGGRYNYKIKAASITSFVKLKKIYCDKKNIDINSVRFLYDDHLIGPNDTPNSLGMVDNDIIDAVVEQTGG